MKWKCWKESESRRWFQSSCWSVQGQRRYASIFRISISLVIYIHRTYISYRHHHHFKPAQLLGDPWCISLLSSLHLSYTPDNQLYHDPGTPTVLSLGSKIWSLISLKGLVHQIVTLDWVYFRLWDVDAKKPWVLMPKARYVDSSGYRDWQKEGHRTKGICAVERRCISNPRIRYMYGRRWRRIEPTLIFYRCPRFTK